jgi:hypothetical protein
MLTTFFTVCAVLGGTIMICQMVLMFIGMAGDSLHLDVPQDAGHGFGGDFHGGGDFHAGGGDLHAGGDVHAGTSEGQTDVAHQPPASDSHGSTWFFKMLSFRTMIAAIAFFGIAGLGAQEAEAAPITAVAVAIAAGIAAMYGVFWLMQTLAKLRAEGTIRVQRALGKQAVVYLRIPGEHSGMGKVQVNLQNRTMEYEAMTSGPALPTGAEVVVVDVVSSSVLEVQAVPEPDRAERNSYAL